MFDTIVILVVLCVVLHATTEPAKITQPKSSMIKEVETYSTVQWSNWRKLVLNWNRKRDFIISNTASNTVGESRISLKHNS